MTMGKSKDKPVVCIVGMFISRLHNAFVTVVLL